MKRIYIIFFVLIFYFPAAGQLDRTKVPTPGPAPEIKIGTPESFELKNGLKVIVVENHKSPRVAFNLVLDFEAILEGEKAGYAAMAGDLLRTGTTSKTKSQIDEAIDFIGASLNTSASGIYAASLTKHQDALLGLMTDVLYNPSFPGEELEKLRKQTLSGLAAQKEDPGAVASNVRSAVLYGKEHPYGELTTEETVQNITIEDCRDFYNTYFTPEIAYLAIVGDIKVKDAKKLAKKYFGDWENKSIELPAFSAVAPPDKIQVALVDRPNSVQSEIRVGYPINLKKGDPDVVKANLMNTILGAGFSSRIMQNLREQHAFTYGARSSISSDMIVGNFNAFTSVRNEVTDSAIYQLLHELRRIVDEDVTEKELASAKAYITGSFARSLESPQTIANFALNTKRYNLPEDYYSNYLKRLDAVTVEEIRTVAKKYIKPDNAHIIVVGRASEIADNLSRFGELTYYDIYGNSYVPEKVEIPAGLTVAKVFENYILAIGGEEKVRALKDAKIIMKAEMQGRELEISSLSKSPNMSKTNVLMGGMAVMTQIYNGTDASISQMGQSVPLDEKQKKDMAYQSAIIEEIAIIDMGLSAELKGVETINGLNAYAIEITKPSGDKTTYYYSAESGLKIKESATVQGPQGEMIQETSFADYREVDGVKFPFTITFPMGPMKMEARAESIELNTGIEDSEFAIP
ncbi:MAG: insulinase family protein [Cytophagales bacterium]|nr:insulinase family protein [Cytophagales bacterium]